MSELIDIQKRAHLMAFKKGWHEQKRELPELLMLIVSEFSETLGSWRDNELAAHNVDVKPEGWGIELADAAIRHVAPQARGEAMLGSAGAPALDGRAVLERAVTEKRFLQQVITYARVMGWLLYHTHNSVHSQVGFPDLLMVRGTRIIAVELKVWDKQRKRWREPTAAQGDWLTALERTGKVEAHCWRPCDWDTVEATLRSD